MKISLKKTELMAYLSERLGIFIDDIEILPQVSPEFQALYDKVLTEVTKLNYISTEKIQAIKTLREITRTADWVMTLADAKWAIENWNAYIKKAYQNCSFRVTT